MARKTRTAILKGYKLQVVYVDGSGHTEEYDTDELGTLEDQLTSLFLSELDAVSSFQVVKVWSEPGETVTLKVKQQGE
jgi:hypothetical protein